MTYNFYNDPTPAMQAEIDPTGGLNLSEGSPQVELITSEYSGSTVSVSIVPPTGWSLDYVEWSGGGSGTITVPPVGTEHTHAFTYGISQNGTRMSDGGDFKIKNQGNGGGSGGGG